MLLLETTKRPARAQPPASFFFPVLNCCHGTRQTVRSASFLFVLGWADGAAAAPSADEAEGSSRAPSPTRPKRQIDHLENSFFFLDLGVSGEPPFCLGIDAFLCVQENMQKQILEAQMLMQQQMAEMMKALGGMVCLLMRARACLAHLIRTQERWVCIVLDNA